MAGARGVAPCSTTQGLAQGAVDDVSSPNHAKHLLSPSPCGSQEASGVTLVQEHQGGVLLCQGLQGEHSPRDTLAAAYLYLWEGADVPIHGEHSVSHYQPTSSILSLIKQSLKILGMNYSS